MTVDINKTESSDFSEAGIHEAIKADFLAYLEDANKDIRRQFPDYPDDMLAHILLPEPEKFEWNQLNQARALTWESREVKGSPRLYYIIPVEQNYFVSITISYHTSLNDDTLIESLTKRIQNDISLIMDSLVITKYSEGIEKNTTVINHNRRTLGALNPNSRHRPFAIS